MLLISSPPPKMISDMSKDSTRVRTPTLKCVAIIRRSAYMGNIDGIRVKQDCALRIHEGEV